MKIIQSCNYVAPAKDSQGAQRIVERVAKGLVKLGHDVLFHNVSGEFPIAGTMPALTKDLWDCDVIHFHGWDFKDYEKYRKPWVSTIHGYEIQNGLPEKYKPNNVIGVSQFAAKNIGARHYVWNCADADEFKFQEKKDDYFLWMNGTDWGESKGLFTTIGLAKNLKFKLKIAGNGKNQDNIEKIKEACDSRIEYVGALNGEEKVKYLQNAKAIFVPTRLPDACPVVVSEALMCGTPVIGSKCGAMPEIVLHNVTGFNCENLSEYIRSIKTVERISTKTCRDFAEKHFSLEMCAKNYINCYERSVRQYQNESWSYV